MHSLTLQIIHLSHSINLHLLFQNFVLSSQSLKWHKNNNHEKFNFILTYIQHYYNGEF